ncbi:hypothetical protein BDV95DRAFT_610712 [Massariosphaeria phaeospora]|uniref:Uncharacterized protein n=1 Tax=Massariosphaeria phaeospora TaxID=100035 RepID=A0A7C8M3H2_9PLEO|nr:hypothetical protein BDV95DRAFT_610712 [Massariosphaeria phaeospora]
MSHNYALVLVDRIKAGGQRTEDNCQALKVCLQQLEEQSGEQSKTHKEQSDAYKREVQEAEIREAALQEGLLDAQNAAKDREREREEVKQKSQHESESLLDAQNTVKDRERELEEVKQKSQHESKCLLDVQDTIKDRERELKEVNRELEEVKQKYQHESESLLDAQKNVKDRERELEEVKEALRKSQHEGDYQEKFRDATYRVEDLEEEFASMLTENNMYERERQTELRYAIEAFEGCVLRLTREHANQQGPFNQSDSDYQEEKKDQYVSKNLEDVTVRGTGFHLVSIGPSTSLLSI